MGKMTRKKPKRLSDTKYRLIFRCFVADVPASKTAQIVKVNRKTADRYYRIFRSVIINDALKERKAVKLGNGIELDESYFGPKRVRGKRGRGASHKVIVFGILKRKGRIYTNIVPNTKKASLMPIIRQVIRSGADIYTDGWRSYDALAVYGYNHKKVRHDKDEFSKGDGKTHINGIESYWSWTKHRLTQFRGLTPKQFKNYLLESEWRYNHRHTLEKDLRGLLKNVI